MVRNNDKLLSLLGLARKAGRLGSGEFVCEKNIKEGKAYLVIIAKDASDNTKKNFHDACKYYNVPIIEYGDKESLGSYTGTRFRASISITDEGFANSILKIYESLRNTEVVIDE